MKRTIKRRSEMWPELVKQAALLRKNQTKSEKILWGYLRIGRYGRGIGYKFRRQVVLYGYIVDFWCPKLRLAVEVVGSHRDQPADYEAKRTQHLKRWGITTLEVPASELRSNSERCFRDLYLAAQPIVERHEKDDLVTT